MTFRDLSFSRAPRTQLAIKALPSGGLEVTTWNMVAKYALGEFSFDHVRDELHLVNSRGASWTVRDPALAN